MSEEKNNDLKSADELRQERRDFLKHVCTSSAAALVVATTPSEAVDAASNPDADATVAEYFQGHFLLMSEDEKLKAIARLEKRYSAQYMKKTTVSNTPA